MVEARNAVASAAFVLESFGGEKVHEVYADVVSLARERVELAARRLEAQADKVAIVSMDEGVVVDVRQVTSEKELVAALESSAP